MGLHKRPTLQLLQKQFELVMEKTRKELSHLGLTGDMPTCVDIALLTTMLF